MDPQPGDAIHCKDGKFRCVLDRRGHDVDYADRYGRKRNCWISTWQDWCASQTIERIVKGKAQD
jgi:hypothetical protein